MTNSFQTSFKLALLSLFVLFSASLQAAVYGEYQEHSPTGFWQLKGGAGFAMTGPILDKARFSTRLDDTTLPNNLIEQSKKAAFAPYLSFQKSFVLDWQGLYALAVGPTLYYEQLESTGQGLLNIPIPPDPYNYSFTNKQIALMLEAQWTPLLLWNYFAPYFFFGLGLNNNTNNFSVNKLDPDSSFPVPANVKMIQMALALDVGLGVEVMFNQFLGIDLRYVYLYNFCSKITDFSSLTQVLSFQNNTQNILVGIVWRFGVSDA